MKFQRIVRFLNIPVNKGSRAENSGTFFKEIIVSHPYTILNDPN